MINAACWRAIALLCRTWSLYVEAVHVWGRTSCFVQATREMQQAYPTTLPLLLDACDDEYVSALSIESVQHLMTDWVRVLLTMPHADGAAMTC